MESSIFKRIYRGDIYYVDFGNQPGSVEHGVRPAMVVQNDVGNRYSPTVIAAAITSKMGKAKLPTHIDIFASDVGLTRDSVTLLEQIRTLDKRRLKARIGELSPTTMRKVNLALLISLGFNEAKSIASR